MNIGDRVKLVDYPGLLVEVTEVFKDFPHIRVRITNTDNYKYKVRDAYWAAPDYKTHCYADILSYKVLPLSKLERVLR